MRPHNSGWNRSLTQSGEIAWLEFDIRSGAVNGLDNVVLQKKIGSTTSQTAIKLSTKWRRVKIPLIWSDDYTVSGTLAFQLTGYNAFEAGSKTTFAIGRIAYYHSNSLVPYDKARP